MKRYLKHHKLLLVLVALTACARAVQQNAKPIIEMGLSSPGNPGFITNPSHEIDSEGNTHGEHVGVDPNSPTRPDGQPMTGEAHDDPTYYPDLKPESVQHTKLIEWARKKNEQLKTDLSVARSFDQPSYVEYPTKTVVPPLGWQVVRMRDTTDTYFKNFGKNTIGSLLWTGIESANPLTPDLSYRWDSLEASKIYEPRFRRRMVSELLKLGIKNIRLGMANDKIELDKPETWKSTSDIVDDLYKGGKGMRISLDLHHFGIEDRFLKLKSDGSPDHENSFYLNPEWPDYFANFAAEAYNRYYTKIGAITIMNEPQTVGGFNGNFWHGAYPGWDKSDTSDILRVEIDRSVAIAKASVKARIKLEEFLEKHKGDPNYPRKPIIHTEACAHKTYWDEFILFQRYLESDLILGHPWMLDADFDKLAATSVFDLGRRWAAHDHPGEKPLTEQTSMDWVIKAYLFYGHQPDDAGRELKKQKLFKQLKELQALHKQLWELHRQTMMTYTIFAVDYYGHNEDKHYTGGTFVDGDEKGKPEYFWLSPKPEDYATDVAKGYRMGIYSIIVDYFNRYEIPIMIGETGTPYYFLGSKWNQMMLLGSAKAAEQGIPFLGMTMYPAVDTYGWKEVLTVPKSISKFNPSGLLSEYKPADKDELQQAFPQPLQPRPFVQQLVEALKEVIPL